MTNIDVVGLVLRDLKTIDVVRLVLRDKSCEKGMLTNLPCH